MRCFFCFASVRWSFIVLTWGVLALPLYCQEKTVTISETAGNVAEKSTEKADTGKTPNAANVSSAVDLLNGTAIGDNTLLLERAAKEHGANIKNIRTWQGTIIVTNESIIRRNPNQQNDPLMTKTKGSVEFVCDRQRNAFRSNYSTDSRETSGAREREMPKGAYPTLKPVTNIMVKDDAYYRFNYDAEYLSLPSEDGKRMIPILRVVSIRPYSGKLRIQALGNEIDPFYWFTYRGRDVSEVFTGYCNWAKAKQNLSHVSLSQKGSTVTLTVRGGESFNAYTIDMQQGANLVEYNGSDGPGRQFENWTYDYTEVNGTWVPKKVRFENVIPNDSEWTRTLEWVKNVVNEPVKEDEFSLVKLGVRQGDEVQDNLTGKSYFIQGVEYPPKDEARAVK